MNKIKYGLLNFRAICAIIIIMTFASWFLTACSKNVDEVISMTEEPEEEVQMIEEVSDDTDNEPEITVEDGKIFVFVCGAVNSPGVYELPRGSRAYEAIEKAGGLREDADINYVNQAKVLNDEERLRVYSVDEVDSFTDVEMEPEAAEEKPSDGKVNINTATVSDLVTLNGIGEARAAAIISYREQNGRFNSIEEIKNVNGIKDSVFNSIKDSISVG